MDKINCILLVDDDPTTNFLNTELIEDLDICNQIHVVHNGQEALDFINLEGSFKKSSRNTYAMPDIIFLDINMPLMDGFEFLSEFNKSSLAKRGSIVIILLTTSDAINDKLKSELDTSIYQFIEKPLREKELLKLRDEYLTGIRQKP
jgi:CheY-like chemotaxis protein